MSRDIKFRAWDKLEQAMHDTVQLFWENDKTYWAYAESMPLQHPADYDLMQYTGLKDKNGVEIYEGDIVDKQYHNLQVDDGVGVVEMGTGSDSDGWSHGEWVGWKAGSSSLLDVAAECNIIGNIYENPELLEVKAS